MSRAKHHRSARLALQRRLSVSSDFGRRWGVMGVVAASLALGSGCSTLEVTVDVNPRADFTRLQTWTFKARSPQATAPDPRFEGRRLEARIEEQITARLSALGLTRATTATPDFEVGYRVAVKRALGQRMLDERDQGGMLYVIGGHSADSTATRTYEEGRLLIEFINPENEHMLWRAWTTAEVDLQRSPEENQRLLKAAVKRILETYPPRPS